MKNIFSTTTLLLTFTIISTQVLGASVATKLCNSIRDNDRKQFRTLLESNQINLKQTFSNARCSGQNLLQFASKNRSTGPGIVIINRITNVDILANMASLENGPKELLNHANKRFSKKKK